MRDEAVLLQLVQAAQAIQSFTAGTDYAGFAANPLQQSAVLYQISIIGEAVKQRLSQGFKDAHPTLPWRAIGNMRNRVIHQYDSVDLVLVWEVVKRDIPTLLRALQPLLPPASGGPQP
jgi:uncharacterized protein with HEPN domain